MAQALPSADRIPSAQKETALRQSIYTQPVVLATTCVAVGVLAALGKFNSISNFPVIFALVCLGVGLLPVWRDRPRRAPIIRATILLIGVGVAVGGWLVQGREAEERRVERRLEVLEVMQGSTVPSLAGLEPLNGDSATWDEAASLTANATIVSFWARWCSPCWKEMEELEDFYRQHQDDGLRVVALTRYDRPDDAEGRRSDFTKAQRFFEGREFTYPGAITDRDDLYRAYRVSSPPSTFLVDSQGRVVDYAISLGSFRSLMQDAARLLEEAPPG